MTTPDPSLHGQVALVTGATNGIGKVIARDLAARGARVYIVGRDADKTARVARDLQQATGGDVRTILGDLSVQADVRRVAREYRAAEPRLHILVNNAGAFYRARQETRDGIEMTFALNHLAYFLLTQELLPVLTATPGARIVNTSSMAHTMTRLRWHDPEFKLGYRGWSAYAQSKLANVLFTRELARRLRGTDVTVNAFHPGLVRSGFAHNNQGLTSALWGLLRPFSVTEEQGARTAVYLATSADVAGLSGLYFTNEHVAPVSAEALDDAAAERLWRLSETYVQPVH
ncbi:SDR family oxidoreductase [Deinococcus maricopensis]|uniref:Short-chain dehydrogenase/reductase SDR n=1 Tax=Deinococcus maricopensis (strain DSM 21211 / LMG 22137 / NRRL B-23946 / LB-34) TaxID=709986 RepID=E8UAA8_DEIML|nr:SDR family oxidoreductase [Deinococcus maricopensis]ADV67997.1 short-chain dehydrogenase/reductase SDR [Deinococcus maricopensis DSM 21211]